ncbi:MULTISPECIES: UBP-type zinc finger domain-containing protein [unclassified Geodermatophilus]
MADCTHLDQVDPAVVPDTEEGCGDCLREGSSWVHLRECLTCGHVACCDSSPRRHATAHSHGSGHPLVRSFEPGESWWWCYPDQVMLQPRA